jgi:hypothetical protein
MTVSAAVAVDPSDPSLAFQGMAERRAAAS